jgi:hypothetical protein
MVVGVGVQRPLTRREERFNTWLTVCLLAGIVVAGNMLASERFRLRRDLSEDQLFTVAPATERILQGLEERLQVRTYFTRDTELGDVHISTRTGCGVPAGFTGSASSQLDPKSPPRI